MRVNTNLNIPCGEYAGVATCIGVIAGVAMDIAVICGEYIGIGVNEGEETGTPMTGGGGLMTSLTGACGGVRGIVYVPFDVTYSVVSCKQGRRTIPSIFQP
jgi:hypothetical protein